MNVTIQTQQKKRKLKDGSIRKYVQYAVNYPDPETGKRRQSYFRKKKEAIAEQKRIMIELEQGTLCDEKQVPTLEECYDYWVENKKHSIKSTTYKGLITYRSYLVGPLLIGADMRQRREYALTGDMPDGSSLKSMLGNVKVNKLTTARIRSWHNELIEHVGHYSANRAMQRLHAILCMVEEDLGVRTPKMPRRLTKSPPKTKKVILSPDEISTVLRVMREDSKWGLYVAWGFLTGTRISEQLALHWDDISFEDNTIHIHRSLEKNGKICEFTKTESGDRLIPMNSLLREWLLEWRVRCPRRNGNLELVFPSQGAKGPWPIKKVGGGVLLYSNFRQRVWVPAFEKLAEHGVKYTTTHAARHAVVSILQAQGIEVPLVAQIVGHKDPSVTLSYYSHPVRDGHQALSKLQEAYTG